MFTCLYITLAIGCVEPEVGHIIGPKNIIMDHEPGTTHPFGYTINFTCAEFHSFDHDRFYQGYSLTCSDGSWPPLPYPDYFCVHPRGECLTYNELPNDDARCHLGLSCI